MLELQNISKTYSTAAGPVPVLNGISLKLQRGESLSIMGPSGSGKSTLLYILGVLEAPSAGTISMDGENPFTLGEKKQAAFRNRKIGFLFQDHCLLPQCSVLENTLTPLLVDGKPDEASMTRAKGLLDRVGLSSRLDHRPGELSGGEKQRAALARALIREPLLLLCDEPTGNLDGKSADNVAELLSELHKQQKTILVAVTHNAEFADRFQVRMEMRDQALHTK